MTRPTDDLEAKGAKAVSAALSRLILGHDAAHCFFATLALKIAGGDNAVADWSIPTCCTDGRKLRYNPDFMARLSSEEAEFVMAHEVLHCTNNHHTRRGARDLNLFNITGDLVINPILRDARIGKPPTGALFPGAGDFNDIPAGLSTEETYARLLDEAGDGDEPGGEEPGQLGDDPGGCGGVEDAGDDTPADLRGSEAEWEVAVAQAYYVAKQRGDLPGALADLVQRALDSDTSVADYLWEFISRHARNDFSWTALNRRFLSQGLCLPGMQSEELGTVICMVDGSGSCWDPKIVQRFAQLLQGVLETFDCELTIIYHDIPVHAVETWKSTDGALVLTPRGGGGTSHVPAFKFIDEYHLEPTCVVALTDCWTTYPSEPGYPVLWACVGNPNAKVPFGTLVQVEGKR